MYYVIAPDGRVESFGKSSSADARRVELSDADPKSETQAYCVSTQAALKDVPTALLITLYNIAASEPESHAKTITKFSDRQTAEKRVWPVIEYLAKPGTAPAPSTVTSSEEGDMAAKKKTTKKKSTRAEGSEGTRGRISKFAGKKLYKLVSENPRRKGTHGYKAFELITSGMLYETYIKNGGEPKHLQWDIEHKFIEVKNA